MLPFTSLHSLPQCSRQVREKEKYIQKCISIQRDTDFVSFEHFLCKYENTVQEDYFDITVSRRVLIGRITKIAMHKHTSEN